MVPEKILVYVQYLLGIGHVRRCALIVEAMVRQGMQVDVVFGGIPVPSMPFTGAKMHYLLPLKSADAAFSGLVKADSSELTQEDKQQRVTELLSICEQLQPDLIITETYPFGRRQMRFELLPLLNCVKQQEQPPVLVASIRDILQRRSDKREIECIDIIEKHYQHVLVHGDATFFSLENSFPRAQAIADKIHYTGYVCPVSKTHVPLTQRDKSIIVSIGGGSVGKEILQTALALFQSGFARDYQWTLVTGPNMSALDKAYFLQQGGDRLQVVELADNFLLELGTAAVSVSMAGYNTVMDLLQTATPAVVIPFQGEGETEQMTRSEILAKNAVLTLLPETQLSVTGLKQAIEQAMSSTSLAPDIATEGASVSAQLVQTWAKKGD